MSVANSGSNSGSSSLSISPVQGTSISSDTNILREGSSVFVRVLSAGKGGQYTVSFAGGRFDVFSQRTLEPGNAFRAMVSVKDGKVFLAPESVHGRANAEGAVQRFSSFAADSSGRLATFLQQMGLPIDSISLRLVQFFQEAGVKFNFRAASKARSIGLKFPGRENEAAEIALFLEQKGIDADMDTVMELLDVLYGSGGKEGGAHMGSHEQKNDHEQEDDSQPHNDMEPKNGDVPHSENFVHASSTHTENTAILDNLYEDSIHILDGQSGLLTFINQYRTNPLHWVILPFEYGEKENRANGTIRLLLDGDKKITKKIAISAYLYSKTYIFMIECNSKTSNDNKQKWVIEFCSQPDENEHDTERVKTLLLSLLPKSMDFSVQYCQELAEAGFFTLGTNIPLVQVDA